MQGQKDLVVRALERVGDQAMNVGEYIIYLAKGKDMRHISLKGVEKNILS